MDLTTGQIVLAFIAFLGGSAMATALTLYATKGKTKAETGDMIVQTAEKVVELQQEMVVRTIEERTGMEHKLEAALKQIAVMQEQMIQMRVDQGIERATCDLKLAALQSQIGELQYHQKNPTQFPQEHLPTGGQ